MNRSILKTTAIVTILSVMLMSFAGCVPKSGDAANEKSKPVMTEERVLPTSSSKENSGTLESYKLLVESKNAKYYSITYWSDGLWVKGYLGIPNEGKKLPAVVYNRGGNLEFGALMGGEVAAFAEAGYVTIASQYRGNGGGEGKEEFGGADVNDVVNAVSVLESLSFVDKEKIGMFGISRGGMMTALAIKHYYELKQPIIKAAVIASGLYDLEMWAKERPAMLNDVYLPLFGGGKDASSQEFIHELKKRSATQWPDALNVPLLILHGTADERISFKQAEKMVNLLKGRDIELKYAFYEGDNHSLNNNQKEVRDETLKWFNSHLKPDKPVTSVELDKDNYMRNLIIKINSR